MRTATRQTNRELVLPAPLGGINTMASLGDMPASDCVFLYNVVAAELGLRTRLGYVEFAPGLSEVPLTLMPFTGKTSDLDALFYAGQSGIYDVTTGVESKVVNFGSASALSGRGVPRAFTTLGGSFLFFADEQNGLFRYDGQAKTWTQPGDITVHADFAAYTLNVANVAHVASWANRIWMVEKNSARAWYLPVGAISGAAKPFNFGTKFRAGGNLVGLWSWTVDGGISGMNDYLVAVSSEGDVVIYGGSDPDVAGSFAIVGVWNVGAVPTGRNVCTDLGGELLIMSAMGLLPISRLRSGAVVPDRSQYLTAKISNLFARIANQRGSQLGWDVRLNPEDGTLLVIYPDGDRTSQLAYSILSKSWSMYRDLPMVCSAAWGNQLYFGTPDKRICVNTGFVDNVTQVESTRAPIKFAGLTAFQTLGTPRSKMVQLVRPNFLSQSLAASCTVVPRYGFDLTAAADTSPAQIPSGDQARWDTAIWDQAKWPNDDDLGFFTGVASSRIGGAQGLGPYVGLAFSGSASERVVLASFDVVFTLGGFL